MAAVDDFSFALALQMQQVNEHLAASDGDGPEAGEEGDPSAQAVLEAYQEELAATARCLEDSELARNLALGIDPEADRQEPIQTEGEAPAPEEALEPKEEPVDESPAAEPQSAPEGQAVGASLEGFAPKEEPMDEAEAEPEEEVQDAPGDQPEETPREPSEFAPEETLEEAQEVIPEGDADGAPRAKMARTNEEGRGGLLIRPIGGLAQAPLCDQAVVQTPDQVQGGEQAGIQVDAQAEAQSEAQAEVQAEAQTEAQVEVPAEVQADAVVEAQAVAQTEAQAEVPVEVLAEVQTEAQTEVQDGGQILIQAQAGAQAEEQALLQPGLDAATAAPADPQESPSTARAGKGPCLEQAPAGPSAAPEGAGPSAAQAEAGPSAPSQAECLVCMETVAVELGRRAPCTHFYCRECFEALCLAALGDRTLIPVQCCKRDFPQEWLHEVFDAEQRSKYERLLGEMSQDEIRGKLDPEFVRLAEENRCKLCPKCGTAIELVYGCNHITCFTCRHEFCYVCLAAWVENGHCGCPLYSEEMRALLNAHQQDFAAPDDEEGVEPAAALNDLHADGQQGAVRVARPPIDQRVNRHAHGWVRTRVGGRCTECHWLAPSFIFACNDCPQMRCHRCVYNRHGPLNGVVVDAPGAPAEGQAGNGGRERGGEGHRHRWNEEDGPRQCSRCAWEAPSYIFVCRLCDEALCRECKRDER